MMSMTASKMMKMKNILTHHRIATPSLRNTMVSVMETVLSVLLITDTDTADGTTVIATPKDVHLVGTNAMVVEIKKEEQIL